jgi:hypothetical protein
MEQWEYQVATVTTTMRTEPRGPNAQGPAEDWSDFIGRHTASWEAKLNLLGQDGWEAVQAWPSSGNNGWSQTWTALMKRQLAERGVHPPSSSPVTE